jgi:DNA repair exonuclease SbcCD ATPase subunit
VAAQDDVKLFINQGTSKRRKDLSRFLDLDIFDKMYEQAKNDVNINKGVLRNLPDRDWSALEQSFARKLTECDESIKEKDHLLHDASQRLQDLRGQLASFKDFNPVTKTQVEAQQSRVTSLVDKLVDARGRLAAAREDVDRLTKKVSSIEVVQAEHDLGELKRRLEAYRTLESSFESLKLVHESDALKLKQQERSLKILDDVPCGDSFPGCKFIKDAFKNKEKVEPQREKVQRALEKLSKAELALEELRKEGLIDKVTKIEQLNDLASKLRVNVSNREVEIVRLEATIAELDSNLTPAKQRLEELKEALKNEENVEVVTLRNSLDELQRTIKRLDTEKLATASEAGRIQSDLNKMEADRKQRQDLLQLMKAHELIAQAFSRRGIPSLIVASQLPLINAEVAKILNGIVNFTVELEQDDDSDSMEVYIDYGDSKRIIELGSGMEKMIASVAIRVALINISSLPKTDMFIIDESFGPLDPASVEACNRLLTSLKRYFKTIIVITHVEGVKDVADHIIEVQKIEKDAKVVYNDSSAIDRLPKSDS